MGELFVKINNVLLELEMLYNKRIDWWDYNENDEIVYGEFIEDKEPFAINLKEN